MKTETGTYGKFLENFEIPSAVVDVAGKVVSTNESLQNFFRKRIKKGDDLILQLKKKALK